ncbi:MAG: tripartite tricarboxylate transporter TctB family protein [Rhodothermales bacterium]|nr:tripartite tricarboxylate transporter TctB family protein [Rhodothermales bacterium]
MTMADAMRRLPGLCAIALGLGIAGYAGVFPEMDGGYPGPGLFPRLVGIGLAACGLALVWRPGSAEGATEGGDEMGWLGRVRFAAGLLLVIAFPWLHSVVGFFIATTLLALSVGLMLGARWVTAALTSALASGVIYLLFTRLLGVPL